MMIKTGVLVFGMILLVLLAPFVASFTDSNFAMRSGSFGSGSYLGSQGIGLYGQSSQEICSSGQDFVVQVAPFGCTPTVVRSDLLEEQNVAVFCPLIATQLNPLIEIDRIDSVSFSGQERSPGISGIGFHPTRAALGFSSSSPIGSPVANDIGYAVIVLKQEKSEANMPDFVNGTLVANLRYKMRDIGVGSVTYYIPEMDSSEWENSFNQYGFWGDKGYIKVDGVGENSATISVYSGGDAKNKLRSFTLTKGKSSNEFYVPGFFCQAGAVLRLDDLVNPDTRARLSVSGEIVEIKKGETFLDNKCRIMDLASQGLLQNIDVRCEGDDGVVNFELSRSPSVKIKVDGEEYNVGVGHRIVSKDGTGIYLGDVRYSGQSEDQSNLQVSIFPSSSSLLELPTITASMKSSFKTIEAEKMSEQFGYEFELIGFSDGVNSDFSTFDSGEEFEEYFSGAMGDYDDVVDNFGSEVVGILGDADYTYGRQALVEAIKLADSVNQNEEAVKLCNEFSEIYSGESLGLCAERGVFANLGTSVYGVNVNGHFKEISFLDISEPSFREYGVVLSVGAESVSLTKGERKTIKSGEYVQLVSLDENSVKLNVGLKPSDESKDFIEKSVTLKEGESQTYGSNYNFGIADINIEKVAKISLSPNIKVDGTSSNFSFQIGIEKRAIQLTPEKTESRINTLNETIEKWTELSDNLEGIVKGFNAACIATQTVLTVKNLFTGMGGTAIARQDVNAYWKGVCKDYEALEFNSIDDCLVKNSDKIEASIKARANEIKSFNEEGINDDNRDDRLEDIASGLINQRFADPNDPGKNITIDKNFTDALLKTDSEGYLMSDREMRDIDMELSILASNPNDPIARDKFDKLMGNFYVRSGLEVGARTAADSYGINPKFVTVSAEGVKEDIAVDEFLLREGITDRPKEMTEKFARIYIDASTDTEYLVGHSADGVVKETYKRVDGAWVKDTEDTNPRGLKFTKYDSSSYKNKYKSPELTFFETSPYKGFPALVPIDSKNGWYAAVKQKTGTRGSIASYDDSGAVSSFSLCNVGKNGREEFNSGLGDDECRVFNPGTGSIYGTFPGLTKAETD
ncbi:hypothetical protein KAR91_67995, partial [Candidatus Pacearchaeota archaeon]|nr:hypothetical protein [Candidatus Pacearchaeota archaeon]